MKVSLAALLTLSAGVADVSARECSTCCSRLAHALGDQVLAQPFQPTAFFSLQESSLVPACIVRPRSAQGVATAVSLLTQSQPVHESSSSGACRFAIKAGGHTPAAGAANIQGGVTINLGSLNATVLSPKGDVASVGPGARWIDVYRALDKSGVAVAGGRNGDVGVGGLVLGGGLSHFAPRVGWASDGVVGFELVLPNGTLTTITATSAPDLFIALKGGGSNFGVVTRFDLAAFPQGNLSVTKLSHDIAHIDAVLDAFTEIAATPAFDPSVSLVLSLLYNATSGGWIVSNSAVYTHADDTAEAERAFKPLLDVPRVSASTASLGVAEYAAERVLPPNNWVFATATFGTSGTFTKAMFASLNASIAAFNPPGGVVWSIALEPLPAVLQAASRARGGNIFGLGPGDGNAFILLLSAFWPNASANAAVEQIAHAALDKVRALAVGEKLLWDFEYLNYAAPYQNPFASYGKENLEFLRRTSQKYDPAGTFQAQVPGGFKLL